MITDVPSSSSSPSPSVKTRRWINHIFISFRGADTRKGFTDHLYAALERRGCIKTFKDDHDLESGEIISEGLIKGIQESMFALVVLSPNYASSRWCLDELQNIIECREKFNQVVFPIFYGVESSDVRYQRGTFEEAFRKHEERFKEEKGKVQRWRDALQKVASYSGWDSKDKHEAALIETIVDHIQKLLIPKLPSWVGNLVGVESRMKKLNSLIGMQLDDVRFIGIRGMGGIGKTTTARLIYESIEEQFNFSCFLANIREVSAKNGIVHIQRELLSHLSVRSNYFHNLYDGVKIIANSLHNKKVLLVLDDISERSQLENLAGKQEWFGPGSRIIITTRDKHLLMTHGVHQTCELEGLVQKEALHLFCLKAFKQDQPKSKYQKLCNEVVEYTRGLPLALEVLGSHLCGRTLEAWHNALKQIRSSPHPEIQNSLKISFESLSSTEREMFLDIACFFKGMNKDRVVEVLENCGHFPQIDIEILIDKSLVTLGRDNILEMHDLLEEMGKNIVFQESPNDPGKRSRLWSQDDISRALTQNKGTEAIQAIVDYARAQPYEARWFSELIQPAAHYYQLYEAKWSSEESKSFVESEEIQAIVESYTARRKSEEIQAIVDYDRPYNARWSSEEIQAIFEDIQAIVAYVRPYEARWSSEAFSKTSNIRLLKIRNACCLSHGLDCLPYALRVLDWHGCPLKTLPLTDQLDVVDINLSWSKIEQLWHGTKILHKLKCINLSFSGNLNQTPDFVEVPNLQSLVLEGCTSLTEIHSSVMQLKKLVQLNLKGCKRLKALPDTIHKLKSLKVLNVSYCSKLSSLPECLQEMNNLEELYASNTAIEELPLCLCHLENIKVVSFAGCKESTSELNCFRVPSAVCRPSLLRRLDLSYCNLLAESIPDGFCGLSLLRDLDLSGNNFVNLPSDISKHSTLEYLCLNSCKKLQSLPELPLSIKTLYSLWRIKRSLTIGKKCYFQGICFPRTPFDMFITGNEIPSWFAPQKSSSFAEIPFPHPSPPTEWLGFALCFLLVADRPLGYYDAVISCYTATQTSLESCILVPDIQANKIMVRDKDEWMTETHVISRNVPVMEPKQPHLYILFLSIGEYLERMHTGYGFGLACWYDGSLIVQAGCRLVCKEDLQDIYGNHSHTSSVGPNEKNQKINNNDGPSS
ncbi:TMV resistance protein N isoform X3 [Arachis hypogaea]|uniref:TMV resistance protein N isoform X3 n=1 Tax=Arachis hypogaea TaxID=3818 RepID=UPI000DEC30B6|nr:TMV resistance protein N isoform X3 [Arachis hypogaea]